MRDALISTVRPLIGVILLTGFALFVWPTRWRYDHMTVGQDTYPVRIDRLSGHADILLPGDGWTPAEDATDMAPGGEEQPQGDRT
jgi:hypothetical protein